MASSIARDGSMDPTLIDVALTPEESAARANRKVRFRQHLVQTHAEKELVDAFARMYRMNETPEDPLEWLLTYFERDMHAQMERAEKLAVNYKRELQKAESEREELLAKVNTLEDNVRSLKTANDDLKEIANRRVLGVVDDGGFGGGGNSDTEALKEAVARDAKKEKKEKKETQEKKSKKEKKEKKDTSASRSGKAPSDRSDTD